MIATLLVAAGMVRGQEVGPRGGFGERADGAGRERQGEERRRPEFAQRGFNRETMLFRLLMDAEVLGDLGLEDEKAEAMREAMLKVQERQEELQAEMEVLNLRQADVMAGLMADRDNGGEEALEIVEQIGAQRTEIAKLTIARILILREHMTDEQIARARAMIQERVERFAERRRGQAPREGAGARGNDAQRRRR